ncbi:MAG TPA: hypothetical protein EYQ25_11900 [Planctomycetes bacterium]|nr:hypothetical protein [Planctomycetota bacterium]HIL36784.1 hypothetical protein [Planctomycetota bacterium]
MASTPDSTWIQPSATGLGSVLRQVTGAPFRIWRARDLLMTGLARDLRGRVAGTVLGPLWPFAQPAMLLVVYGFLFTTLLSMKLPGATDGAGWSAYLLVGTLAWSSVAECATRGASSLLEGRELVRKLAYPIELLPLVPSLSSTLLLGGGALVVIVLGGFSGYLPWNPAALALPLIMTLHLGLVLGIAWSVAGLNAGLRDVGQVLPLLLTAMMLATPVFWVASPEVIPGIEPWLPWIEGSPFTCLLDAWRAVLCAGRSEVPCPPLGQALATLVPYSLGALALGRMALARLEPLILDEI